MDYRRSGPTRVWYGLGTALILAGIGGAFAWAISVGFVGFESQVNGFQRLPVQGGDITFSRTGNYTVYSETNGGNRWNFNYNSNRGQSASHIQTMTIVESATSRAVPIAGYKGTFSYQSRQHTGTALGTFHLDSAGTYHVTTNPPANPSDDLAFGQGFAHRAAVALIGATLLGFVGFIVGLIMIIVTAVRRSRARREAAVPQPGYQYPWSIPPQVSGPPSTGWS